MRFRIKTPPEIRKIHNFDARIYTNTYMFPSLRPE